MSSSLPEDPIREIAGRSMFCKVLHEAQEASETSAVADPNPHLTFGINALILCDDSHFLKTLERVFAKLGVNSQLTADYTSALATLEQRKVDAMVVDWEEISDLGEFLETVRQSKMNKECL